MIRQLPKRVRADERGSVTLEGRFAELTAQLETLRAQVRQAQQLASLGTAAAMLAHEVNNLLTPIRGYAEYALKGGDVELMRKALSVTTKNTQMLIGMSSRILEISAAKPRQREAVPLRRVVDDALASLCRDLSKDGIDARVDVDARLNVQADPLQLQQVLFNLLLNAREAMADRHGGRLCIKADADGDRVRIDISNTGDPIPAELLGRLFEPFQTSKPSRRDGRDRCGGLGLALCRDLVEENAGTIEVFSGPDPLTTFSVTLPAARNSDGAPGSPPPRPE